MSLRHFASSPTFRVHGEIAMQLQRRQFLQLTAGAAALPVLSRVTEAQAYPTRPVRMIVPFGPGGPTDVAARLIAQKLSEGFGRQVYVENVPGASANIGTGQAARAAPDGHTILITVNNHVINPSLFEKIPFDPYADFEPVTLAVTFASSLCVHPTVAATTVNELVALIRANPGKYNFASPGLGTPSHLLGEQFRVSLGLDLLHVPFNGSGPAIASAVAGHTPIAFAALAAAEPQVRDGRLRALAIPSKKRSRGLPDTPTMAEAGYPDIEGDGWVGALVPARTPKEIVATLHREIVKIVALPDVTERLTALGLEPVGTTPAEFATQIRAEGEKWAKVIRAANIRAQ
jgi:tripartite-type tricarboxylate transporter receptor subunit TctC